MSDYLEGIASNEQDNSNQRHAQQLLAEFKSLPLTPRTTLIDFLNAKRVSDDIIMLVKNLNESNPYTTGGANLNG